MQTTVETPVTKKKLPVSSNMYVLVCVCNSSLMLGTAIFVPRVKMNARSAIFTRNILIHACRCDVTGVPTVVALVILDATLA